MLEDSSIKHVQLPKLIRLSGRGVKALDKASPKLRSSMTTCAHLSLRNWFNRSQQFCAPAMAALDLSTATAALCSLHAAAIRSAKWPGLGFEKFASVAEKMCSVDHTSAVSVIMFCEWRASESTIPYFRIAVLIRAMGAARMNKQVSRHEIFWQHFVALSSLLSYLLTNCADNVAC